MPEPTTPYLPLSPPRVPGFTILRQIGQGGMGDVYLARQEALGRPVALKFLVLEPGEDSEDRLERFQREATLMARVSHPNILTVYDSGEVDGRPYLVMEYVEGGDLRQLLEPGRPMEPRHAREVLRPIGDALACLHRHGILHRDLKPENVLMHHEGNPKVADFGIAVLHTSVESLTRTTTAIGTLGYVAPEQQYRLKVDERADQYSLASLAYEMLTGQRPLGVIAPPSRRNPALDTGVDAVLMRALAEDPADRYPTIRDFADALDARLAELLTKAGRRRLQRWAVRLGLVIAVAAMTGLAAHTWSRPTPPVIGQPRNPRQANGGETPRSVGPLVVPGVATDQPEVAIGERPGTAPTLPTPYPRSYTNTLGMTLVRIPPGSYRMGSPETDPDALPEEKPQKLVRIREPFYLGAHEVTVEQFRRFVESSGYATLAERLENPGGRFHNRATKRTEFHPELNWRNPGFDGQLHERQPVVQVSWRDAVEFCRWLSREEGVPYRLPTEAEWEYACRAGRETRWSFGDDSAALGEYAWYQANAWSGPRLVGTLKPNPAGLFDMHGNAWEWCLNRYAEPTQDAAEALVSPPHLNRPVRGGGWHWSADKTRSASRRLYPPDYRFYAIGFRVCRPLPAATSTTAE